MSLFVSGTEVKTVLNIRNIAFLRDQEAPLMKLVNDQEYRYDITLPTALKYTQVKDTSELTLGRTLIATGVKEKVTRVYRHIRVGSVASENWARHRGPHGRALSPWGGDEAEAEGFGGSKVEADNEVWPNFHPSDEKLSLGTPDLRRNPEGRGHFSSSLCRSSLADTRYASLLSP